MSLGDIMLRHDVAGIKPLIKIWLVLKYNHAEVVESVDTKDLKSFAY